MIRKDHHYFNEFYHLEPYGENGVLFTAEYFQLLKMRGYDIKNHQGQAFVACKAAILETGDEPLSHDNMTGIVCLSKIMNLGLHKTYRHRDWKRRAHPRDIAFYLWAMGGIYRILSLPLMPILYISMLWACWHKKQSMNVLDTDGKLLAWLRFEAFDLKITRYLCTKIIKYRHNCNWADIFEIYFRNEENPNRRHSRRIYG